MFYCRVERDSISPNGHRLTTFVVTYPRIVLAEVGTHRILSEENGLVDYTVSEQTLPRYLSKNSASSRAIPFQKTLDMILADPFVPLYWGLNERGMQASKVADPDLAQDCRQLWLKVRDQVIDGAKSLHDLGIHKQICNRLIEPWFWVTQVISGTQDGWNNFFNLRCHEAAEPHFRHIARIIYLHYKKSPPLPRPWGQWHLPFTTPDEEAEANSGNEERQRYWTRVSVGRTARVSYLTHDGQRNPDEDLGLHDRLLSQIPRHASPGEHQATPLHPATLEACPHYRSNFTGWLQYRKTIQYENLNTYNPSDEEIASWGITL